MGGERPELEALSGWFRRRERDWWGANWGLGVLSLVLMLSALGCYLAHPLAPYDYSRTCFALYLMLLGPALVFLLFTLQLIHSLPHEDIALPFSPATVYRAVLNNAIRYALVCLAVLWPVAWAFVYIVDYVSSGFFSALLRALALQQGMLLLCSLQLQTLVILRLPTLSLRSVHVYLAPVLLFAVNVVTALYWMFGSEGFLETALLESWVQMSAVCFALLFVILLILTGIMPRGFKGYWEVQ